MLQVLIDPQTTESRTWTGAQMPKVARKWPSNFFVDVKFGAHFSAPEQLGALATGKLILTEISTGLLLAFDPDWILVGSGAEAIYRFSLNLNCEPITERFNGDATLKKIEAECEIQWRPGAGVEEHSSTIKFDILRGLITGGEGIPVPTFSGDQRYVMRTGSNIRFLDDDTPQIYNAESDTWHTLWIKNDGAGVSIVIGDGVDSGAAAPLGNAQGRISSAATLQLRNLDTNSFHDITIRDGESGPEINIGPAA